MVEKAYDIVLKRKVEYIGEGLYNVVGTHGTYTVAEKFDETINCNCPGFMRRKRCSHSLAVMMLKQPNLFRTIRKQIKTY